MDGETHKVIKKSTTDVADYTKVLDFEDVDKIAVQLVINSITGTSVAAKIQHSLDGTNWEDVSGAATSALTGASAEMALSIGTFVPGKLQLVVTMVAVTALDHEVYINAHNH